MILLGKKNLVKISFFFNYPKNKSFLLKKGIVKETTNMEGMIEIDDLKQNIKFYQKQTKTPYTLRFGDKVKFKVVSVESELFAESIEHLDIFSEEEKN